MQPQIIAYNDRVAVNRTNKTNGTKTAKADNRTNHANITSNAAARDTYTTANAAVNTDADNTDIVAAAITAAIKDINRLDYLESLEERPLSRWYEWTQFAQCFYYIVCALAIIVFTVLLVHVRKY